MAKRENITGTEPEYKGKKPRDIVVLSKQDVRYRYERMLLRNQPFVFRGDAEAQDWQAKELIKYVVTDLLQWSPTDAMWHMTPELVKQFRLEAAFARLNLPIGVRPKTDIDYAIAYAFDMDRDRGLEAKRNVRFYKRLLDGTESKWLPGQFNGEVGLNRAKDVLTHYLTSKYRMDSAESIYAKFAAPGIVTELETYKLDVPARAYGSPLTYLHATLTDLGIQDNLVYAALLFNEVSKFTVATMRKNKTNKGDIA